MINSEDGRVTCLFGASPEVAFTAIAIMMKVLEKAFPELSESEEGKILLKKIAPFYRSELTEEAFKESLKKSEKALNL